MGVGSGGSIHGRCPLNVSLDAVLDLRCLVCAAFLVLVDLFLFVLACLGFTVVVGVGGVGVGNCQKDYISG